MFQELFSGLFEEVPTYYGLNMINQKITSPMEDASEDELSFLPYFLYYYSLQVRAVHVWGFVGWSISLPSSLFHSITSPYCLGGLLAGRYPFLPLSFTQSLPLLPGGLLAGRYPFLPLSFTQSLPLLPGGFVGWLISLPSSLFHSITSPYCLGGLLAG